MNVVATILVVLTLLVVLDRARRRTAGSRASRHQVRRPTSTRSGSESIGPDLKRFVERLGRAAWGEKHNTPRIDFALALNELPASGDHSRLLTTMLGHVRQIAPGLQVPYLTPRVINGPLVEAAGLFSETDGWVTVTVSPQFFHNSRAARAILCHELSHYVLLASGIREAERLANERLTDVAMFVLGLGDVFLAGFREVPSDQRPGHQLGYLTEAEYEWVDKQVFDLFLSGALQRTGREELESRFKAAIQDGAVRQRLLDYARNRHPELGETALIERVLSDYERDRRR